MESVQVYWIKIRDSFWTLISKLESSVFFERLVSKYEALPPRQQNTYKALSAVFVISIALWFGLSPVLKTRLDFSQNRSFFSLISSMKVFNSKLEAARKEYVPPVGWQAIQANDLQQLQESLIVQMAALGVPEDRYEIAVQGDTLLVHVREATVKQLESLLFQLDGLYPHFHVIRNKTSTDSANKDLLQFEIEIGNGEEKSDGLLTPDMGGFDESETRGEDRPIGLSPSQGNHQSNDHMNHDDPFSDEALGIGKHEASPHKNDISIPEQQHPSSGGVPGFTPPTFSPIDGDGADGDYAPSNRSGQIENGFTPPSGEDFIPPPPPTNDEDGGFDVVPIPDDQFPPQPPE